MATLASNGYLEVEDWVKPSQVKDSQAVYLPGSSDFSRRVLISWHRPAILKDRMSVRQTAQSHLPPPAASKSRPVVFCFQGGQGSAGFTQSYLCYQQASQVTCSSALPLTVTPVLGWVTCCLHSDSPLLTPQESSLLDL